MKVAVVGAGSFVFGPSVLSQAIMEHRLDGIELALMDVDPDVLNLMAEIGRRMACQAGITVDISQHTGRRTALDGADFVICSAARQMHRRFEMDCSIVDEYLPGHLVTEFGGIAGISYSLRQIALITEIVEDMRNCCPDAWLLVSSNPMPRVCQAAHELGVATAGFCSVSIEAYGMLWRLFDGGPLRYPFKPARDRWAVTVAGLNHFCWVVAMRDRETGADLLPELRRRVAAGASSGNPRSEELCRETGYLLVPNDWHTHDFLPPVGTSAPRSAPAHGTLEERQARLDFLRAITDGKAELAELRRHESWERPLDLVAALAYDHSATFHSLNLINQGQIAALPGNVFVETPAVASAAGPSPVEVELPALVLPYCLQTAALTDTIVRAALQRDRRLAHEAVELDPTILDKRGGIQAVDACLQAHADILPRYN